MYRFSVPVVNVVLPTLTQEDLVRANKRQWVSKEGHGDLSLQHVLDRIQGTDALFSQFPSLKAFAWVEQTEPAPATILYITHTVELILGFSRYALSKDASLLRSCVHQSDRESFKELLEHAKRGECGNGTYRAVRPDGQTRWLQCCASPVQDSRQKCIQVFATDVTQEREAAIKSYNLTLEKIRNLQFTLRDVKDANTVYTSFVASGREMLQQECGSVIEIVKNGTKFMRHATTRTTDLNVNGVERDIGQLPPWIRTIYTTRRTFTSCRSIPDAEYKALIGAPVFLNGKFWGMLCFYSQTVRSNFSEQEKGIVEALAQGLSQALTSFQLDSNSIEKSKADAASAAKTSFLSTMTHEIRNPLGGVVGMCQLLRTTALQQEQLDFVEGIETCCDHLLTILDNILDMAKIEANRMEFEQREFELRTCIEQAIEVGYSRDVKKSHLDASYFFLPDVPRQVIGDATRLRQILVNLVGNAIKFTKKGGISISVSAKPSPSDSSNIMLKFKVADTGIGIPQDKIAKLFHEFTQADASVSRLYGGSGLGLAISFKLTKCMGGNMWVESTEGVGSKFCFTIQVKVSDSALEARDWLLKELASGEEKPYQAWIIDDNPSCLASVSSHCSSCGFSSRKATSGRRALDWTENPNCRVPDVAIIDLAMPNMSGTETATKLRAWNPTLPIIFTVNRNSVPHFNQIRGNVSVLRKPFKYEALKRLLAKITGDGDSDGGSTPKLAAKHGSTSLPSPLPAQVKPSTSTQKAPTPKVADSTFVGMAKEIFQKSLSFLPGKRLKPTTTPTQSPTTPRRELTRPRLDISRLGPVESSSANSLSILIAEDNAANQLVLRQMLKTLGYQDVVCVENGLLATEILHERHFDLVFMDLHMPEMDGIEATRYIRENICPHSKPIKIIGLTGCVWEEKRKACYEVGMDDWLPKPVTFVTLKSKLDEVSKTDRPAPPSDINHSI